MKYKNKYLELLRISNVLTNSLVNDTQNKNNYRLNKIGGGNFKYLLHAHFDKDISSKIDSVQSYTINKYKGELVKSAFTYDPAHMTLIYGPVINTEMQPELTPEYIKIMYPGLQNSLKDIIIDDVLYTGVSVFLSMNEVTIKASFESEKLNKLKLGIIERDIDNNFKIHINKFSKNFIDIKDELKKKYPKLYSDDMEMANSMTKPSGWLHCTLAKIDSNVSEDRIIEIIKDCERIMKMNGFIKNHTILKVKEIGINYNKKFTLINWN